MYHCLLGVLFCCYYLYSVFVVDTDEPISFTRNKISDFQKGLWTLESTAVRNSHCTNIHSLPSTCLWGAYKFIIFLNVWFDHYGQLMKCIFFYIFSDSLGGIICMCVFAIFKSSLYRHVWDECAYNEAGFLTFLLFCCKVSLGTTALEKLEITFQMSAFLC